MAKKNDKDDSSATTEGNEFIESADDTEGLVPVHKDGVTIHVHPTCVKAHHDAGWKAQ